jgi:hypothetical protein
MRRNFDANHGGRDSRCVQLLPNRPHTGGGRACVPTGGSKRPAGRWLSSVRCPRSSWLAVEHVWQLAKGLLTCAGSTPARIIYNIATNIFVSGLAARRRPFISYHNSVARRSPTSFPSQRDQNERIALDLAARQMAIYAPRACGLTYAKAREHMHACAVF